jgi:UDP-N-acetylmuramoyl-L-alanyl-D-glutamate--2,6-diaminopimelate ligase
VVTLAELVEELGGCCELAGAGPELVDVRHDSRMLDEGDLFVALRGERADGRRFIADAERAGAAAVLVEEVPERASELPLWVHPEARRIAGLAASRVHGDPSRALTVLAVTGTNGKSTVAHLVGQLLRAAGRVPAVLGTTGHHLAGGRFVEATTTTPDATELHRLFAVHRDLGGDCVVLEASSHALVQGRLSGVDVDVAIYTNLSRDHLDYHRDMKQYAAAKSLMFSTLPQGAAAVINLDDEWSGTMIEAARAAGANITTYSTEEQADLRASGLRIDTGATHLTLSGMGISLSRLRFSLSGRFNVSNALAASAAVLLSGASPGSVVSGLASVSSPPGRLERVDLPAGAPRVFVDYAHTPDALERVLATLREALPAGRGRLVVVFGCGGDRDAGKRAEMGRVAGAIADRVVVTSDNPRSEDPEAITAAVAAGVPAGADLVVEVDRRAAIRLALAGAGPDDVVLVAGKGHETVQLTRDGALPFDDRLVVAEEWL